MTKYILALDQGTTSSRAVLFDHNTNVRGIFQKEFRQIFPEPGWVEHDPAEIWSSQLEVAREALSGGPGRPAVAPGEIAAIGIANQRETTVIWEKTTGAPIHNAIVWQDRRTAEMCAQLRRKGLEPLFRERTGLVLDAYFSGVKAAWLLDNVPGARERARRGELLFGTIDTWLLWNLTGGRAHVTDTSNASRTLMFNIHTRAWDDDLLGLLGVPRAMLPAVGGSSAIYGHTREDLLGAEIPLTGMAGDQQAATFGQACLRRGMAKNTYGTGCFMLLNVGGEALASKNNLLSTVAWTLDRKTEYALEGSVFMAGATIQWLRDGLKIIQSSAEVEALAEAATDNGGVYLVPAFTGLGAPYWDPYARGTIIGLSRGSGREHIARAALESIAYQSADVLEAMREDAGMPISELRVDGGACRNNLLMQFQADILDIPVVRPKVIETTALGAACLAGLAVGFWDSTDEIAAKWQEDRRFEPDMKASRRDTLLHSWKEAVSRAQGWLRGNR